MYRAESIMSVLTPESGFPCIVILSLLKVLCNVGLPFSSSCRRGDVEVWSSVWVPMSGNGSLREDPVIVLMLLAKV